MVEKLSSTKILRLGHSCLKKSKEQGDGCDWCMVAWERVVEIGEFMGVIVYSVF